MEEWFPIWKVTANMLNKQSRKADKEWSYSLVSGRRENNTSPKTGLVTKHEGRRIIPW